MLPLNQWKRLLCRLIVLLLALLLVSGPCHANTPDLQCYNPLPAPGPDAESEICETLQPSCCPPGTPQYQQTQELIASNSQLQEIFDLLRGDSYLERTRGSNQLSQLIVEALLLGNHPIVAALRCVIVNNRNYPERGLRERIRVELDHIADDFLNSEDVLPESCDRYNLSHCDENFPLNETPGAVNYPDDLVGYHTIEIEGGADLGCLTVEEGAEWLRSIVSEAIEELNFEEYRNEHSRDPTINPEIWKETSPEPCGSEVVLYEEDFTVDGIPLLESYFSEFMSHGCYSVEECRVQTPPKFDIPIVFRRRLEIAEQLSCYSRACNSLGADAAPVNNHSQRSRGDLGYTCTHFRINNIFQEYCCYPRLEPPGPEIDDRGLNRRAPKENTYQQLKGAGFVTRRDNTRDFFHPHRKSSR